jgi:hypothetical protein
MQRLVFVTVTDGYFFAGTLATVNSIRMFHPEARVVVVHNHLHKKPLTAGQRRVVEIAGAEIVDAANLAKPGRKLAAWELKAYAASDLTAGSDVLVGIDSDCVLCGRVDDVIGAAVETGKFYGGRDGAGKTYDEPYAVYGMEIPSRNTNYMSTSLYVCALDERNRGALKKWAQACDQAIFGGGKVYPGHGDQGVLNAVLWAERTGAGVETFDGRLWSQHHCYWQDPICLRDGRLFNERAKAFQRSIHCGGTAKFWTAQHCEKVIKEGVQVPCYAWFLALFWFGHSAVEAEHLAPEQRHLVDSLARFRREIAALLPLLTTGTSSRLAAPAHSG